MPRESKIFKIGSAAPHFSLPDFKNQQVGLAECLVSGPVWLEFIRGTWCPNARKRLTEIAQCLPEFTEFRTQPLIIVSENPGNAERYFRKNPSPLTLLLDPDRKVAKAYGVYSKLSLDGWNVARASTFLIDRVGFIRHIFISGDQTETCPIDTLLGQVKSLDQEAKA